MLDFKIIDARMKEFIIQYPCGCAKLLRTGEQIVFCFTCPIQLKLPYLEKYDNKRID